MNTSTAVRAIAAAAHGQPVVFTAGSPGRIARAVADRPNHFYLAGSSGLASSIAIGVALQARNTTVVVDDPDGLMSNLAALVTAGMLTDLPLVHVVLDTAPRSSAGGGVTPSSHTDLCGLAMAAGYARTYTIDRTEKLAELVRTEVVNCPSPVFVRCVLAGTTSPGRARAAGGRRTNRVRPRTDPPAWFTEAA
jgi:sulfopyruvate decarboxylase subunit beta